MENEFNFCRPKKGSFCVECCRGRRCVNLDKLPDQTQGCAGHGRVKVYEDSFYELLDCIDIFCLDGYRVNGIRIDTPEILGQIKDKILGLPIGEFKMGEVIRAVTA
jgi:hypothetical protein